MEDRENNVLASAGADTTFQVWYQGCTIILACGVCPYVRSGVRMPPTGDGEEEMVEAADLAEEAAEVDETLKSKTRNVHRMSRRRNSMESTVRSQGRRRELGHTNQSVSQDLKISMEMSLLQIRWLAGSDG